MTAGCSEGDASPPYEALSRVALAEDRRADEIDPVLLEALEHPHPAVRTAAFRALGRHERPDWLPVIERGLGDPDVTVRGTAAAAIGQAAFSEGAAEALGILSRTLEDERHPLVRGIVAETVGRLADTDAGSRGAAVETALNRVASDPGDAGSLGDNPAMIARPVEFLVRGFDHLVRRTGGALPRTAEALDRLADLASYGRNGPAGPDGWADSGADLASARVRRTSVAVLAATGSIGSETLAEALSDPDAGVRFVAVRALGQLEDVPDRRAQIERLVADPSFLVRLESLGVYDRWLRTDAGCGVLISGTTDENTHVANRALDLLGAARCPNGEAATQVEILRELASAIEDGRNWHRIAHAWLALARLGDREAATLLTRFATHDNAFVRAYAARGATALGERTTLTALADDSDPNVRAAALTGLASLVGRDADPQAVLALSSDDPALVMTAAGLLEGTPAPATAVPALWNALERFTARGRETERDVRLALLSRLGELASPADSVRVRPLLSSFDVRTAEEAAGLLSRWVGRTVAARPSHPPTTTELQPTAGALARLDGGHVVLELERGGIIRIRLAPLLAPTNAIRFAHLAESGALDGRTFHRVVPGFVIQGGSPNANEYSGDGPYTRDEVGLGSHWRGTVGLSTRGRDTGDGQMFVNLVDNLRLDHNYTIYGQVVSGMDVVDAVQEGDVIRSATLELAGER